MAPLDEVTSAMTSLALANPSTLMSLPIELRCKIYLRVFDNDGKKRLLWLNKLTYKWKSSKFLAWSMTLPLLMPKLSQTVVTNIRHIRGQDITQWAKMNKGRARWLLRQLPNLKTFRFHGACHAYPFWSGSECDEGIIKKALEYCGGDFGTVNDTRDIIRSFPLNPNTCKIEFQMVIVWTAIVPDDHVGYEIHMNLNTGKHKIVPNLEDDDDEFELGHWDEGDEVWKELRAIQRSVNCKSSRKRNWIKSLQHHHHQRADPNPTPTRTLDRTCGTTSDPFAVQVAQPGGLSDRWYFKLSGDAILFTPIIL
ncbi:Uu.00g135800.m01.CDS01 [Anthostomella pinea]|uniref:Uu.00g135800.m01.CDS01 n=1 Tax=Anthostomella pinea TaxID=933095 RepID=A0AAI8YL28_9PEZI|nr:Uu.00g135800.m01.CDS01 [Anthostomella pinea]